MGEWVCDVGVCACVRACMHACMCVCWCGHVAQWGWEGGMWLGVCGWESPGMWVVCVWVGG